MVLSSTSKIRFCQPWIENLQWTSLPTQLEPSVWLCWLKLKKSSFWKLLEVISSFLAHVFMCSWQLPQKLINAATVKEFSWKWKLLRACKGLFTAFYCCLHRFPPSLQVIKHKLQMPLKNSSKIYLTMQLCYLSFFFLPKLVSLHLYKGFCWFLFFSPWEQESLSKKNWEYQK